MKENSPLQKHVKQFIEKHEIENEDSLQTYPLEKIEMITFINECAEIVGFHNTGRLRGRTQHIAAIDVAVDFNKMKIKP